MKKIIIFLFLFLLIASVFSGEIKINKIYAPPPEPEMPVLELIDNGKSFNQLFGSVLSGTGIAGGVSVSVLGVYYAADYANNGFESPRVQSGILITGTGVLLSGVSAIILNYFIRSMSKKTTNKIKKIKEFEPGDPEGPGDSGDHIDNTSNTDNMDKKE